MKTLLAVFFVWINFPAFAQLQIPVDTTTGLISYTEIDYADSVPTEILFNKALEWFAINYKSTEDIIRFKNKESGKIIASGMFNEPINFMGGNVPSDCNVYHTLNIEARKGRVKIQITDFRVNYYVDIAPTEICEGGWLNKPLEDLVYIKCYQKAYTDFLAQVDKRIHTILDSFSSYIQAPKEKTDNW